MACRGVIFSLIAVLALACPVLAWDLHTGQILAVGKSSITVRDSRDNEDEAIAVTAETKITRNGKPAKLSDLAIGDKAEVDATELDGKLTAKSIKAFMPE